MLIVVLFVAKVGCCVVLFVVCCVLRVRCYRVLLRVVCYCMLLLLFGVCCVLCDVRCLWFAGVVC